MKLIQPPHRERRLRRAAAPLAVPVWRAHHVAAPRVDTLRFSCRAGGERAAQPRLWKMCSPGDCRLGNAIPTARGSLGTKLCAVKVCVHKRQQRGGALLSLARTALLGLGKCSGHNNSFPRCFCLSMSQLVDANPYKKMAFLDSQKAKIFPGPRGPTNHGGPRGVQSQGSGARAQITECTPPTRP